VSLNPFAVSLLLPPTREARRGDHGESITSSHRPTRPTSRNPHKGLAKKKKRGCFCGRNLQRRNEAQNRQDTDFNMLADDEKIRVKGVPCRTVEAFMLKPGREEG
jgi:hypothetical protein